MNLNADGTNLWGESMGRFINLSVILLFITFISACSNHTEQNKEVEEKESALNQTTYRFLHNKQEFEIISFYEEVLTYTEIMNENPKLDIKKVFTEIVLEPFKEKSSLSDVTLGNPFSTTTEIEQLEKNTKKLLKNQEQINQWIEEAIIESAELLSSGAVTKIYIFPVNPDDWFVINQMRGVNALTYFGNKIVFMIAPTVSEMDLKRVVAHEYHHTVNLFYNREQSMNSVLDLTITEGKAESFANIFYPEAKPPWTEPLPEDVEAKVLKELRENADSTDWKIYNDFFIGNYSKGIPGWSNYKIGYQITESFIENNPNHSVLDWTKINAKEIVKNSEYRDKILQ
ncbi:hypothetical protein E0Y62_21010 [Cytobacillus praedii]|uniref:DUF2268 domain-containing protein n=2 Tax=Cytobacillus praedii TaxID=1742358 RepID=A0A4R1AQ71_9BACI|nr:hypothetical protein E0Y62_21010 [Cytobacillus praedii]